MQFWTKDEYLRFSEAVMDKPLSFHAFELLYWTGIRCGELLALTPSDFMLESSRLRINKSYQSLHGVDTVTDPKTPKSVRTIVMPAFLRDEMADFIEMRDDVAPDERLFAVTKHFLAHEMERGCKASGVKRIRIHDIRHSHVSLLIEMGFSALAIAERMGHEAVDITYRYAHLFPTKQDEMAAALDVSVNALKDYGVETAGDLMSLLVRLEDSFGIVPSADGSGLSLNPKAPHAPKAAMAIELWAEKRARLENGEIDADEYEDWKASL